jgi:hypothetical protein
MNVFQELVSVTPYAYFQNLLNIGGMREKGGQPI